MPTNDEGTLWDNLPNAKIEDFARWAVFDDTPEKKVFRKKAAKLHKFKEVVDGEPAAPDLDNREYRFCEGWLYLALKEIALENPGDPTEEQIDAALVAKAQAHFPGGPNDPAALSG
jgi:hypothetical protein